MKQELERLLTQNDTFMVEGVLNKNKLAELARQYNPELLNLLMSDEKISQHFFATLETGVLVFKKDVFLQFLNNKEFLPDSFTAYKTKIGLASGNKYLSENQDVVLNFPYKDCVLEGGQTKEDAKRQEIFFNETLAPTEINRLLDDKVLTNFKRFDETGETKVGDLKDTDNLIIKGNNLIALHSLKKRFSGRVKLIYIDPPYNTGSDSFGYNDSFNHSTWLVFMKNRIEVASELLSDDGIIMVQCDDREQAYLKVLMDDILDRDNFIGTLIHQRAKGGGQAKHIVKGHDYVTIFAKNASSNIKFVREKVIQGKIVERDGKSYLRNDDVVRKVFGKYDSSLGDRRCFYEELNKYKNEKQIAEIERKIATGEYELEDFGNGMQVICTYVPIDELTSKLYSIVNALGEKGSSHLTNLGLGFSNPKPEELLKFLIFAVTKENDLILDYHLGSGTTAAVAHKMNRQYIGIEQMDYIETVSVERLKKVIAGEQGGISKDVNWTGGGSFVYAELKNDAQDFKNAILEATTTSELLELFETAKKSSFLSYRIDPKKLKTAEFEKLSLAEQKQVLSEIIDNNNLYVNYSDIEDSDYHISEEDKRLNRQFYDEGGQ